LLHDLGKGVTALEKLPAHIGHERAGVPLVDAVCRRLKAPKAAHDLARKVCLDHLNCHRVFEMRPDTVLRMLERLDTFRQPDIVPQFIAACEADYRGRGGRLDDGYRQGEFLAEAHRVASAILARDLGMEEISGPEVGKRLRAARTGAIAQLPKQ
jgi:tRNA nucleotidyltransferase (CCA-adding enzyme)